MGQLASQAAGVLVLCTVMFGFAFLFFKIQNAVTKGGIRPEPAIEIAGLDIPEMGALAYPDFLEQEAITVNAGVSPTHEVSREPETV
jgi:ammonia channel protein AmtB